MLDPALEIQASRNVHELLLSTVKQVRALHATLSALMTDVTPIRRTLLHGPADLVHYAGQLALGNRNRQAHLRRSYAVV